MKKWTAPKVVILIIGLLIVLSSCATNREAQVAYEGQRQVPVVLPLYSGYYFLFYPGYLQPYSPGTPKEPTQQVEISRTWGDRVGLMGLQPYSPGTPR